MRERRLGARHAPRSGGGLRRVHEGRRHEARVPLPADALHGRRGRAGATGRREVHRRRLGPHVRAGVAGGHHAVRTGPDHAVPLQDADRVGRVQAAAALPGRHAERVRRPVRDGAEQHVPADGRREAAPERDEGRLQGRLRDVHGATAPAQRADHRRADVPAERRRAARAVHRPGVQQRPHVHGPHPQLRPAVPGRPGGVRHHGDQLRGRGAAAAQLPAAGDADGRREGEAGDSVARDDRLVRHRREAAPPAELARLFERHRATDTSRGSPVGSAHEAGYAGHDTGAAEEDPRVRRREPEDVPLLRGAARREQRTGERVLRRALVRGNGGRGDLEHLHRLEHHVAERGAAGERRRGGEPHRRRPAAQLGALPAAGAIFGAARHLPRARPPEDPARPLDRLPPADAADDRLVRADRGPPPAEGGLRGVRAGRVRGAGAGRQRRQ